MKSPILLVVSCLILLSSCKPLGPESVIFESQVSGMTGSMRAVDVVDKNTVWMSGSGGEFATTSDGGQSWTCKIVPGAEKLDFRDVHGFSKDKAILMSAGPGESSRIYKTSDAGQHWEMIYQNTEPSGFFDGFDFQGQNAVLFSDPVDHYLNLLISEDGGNTWERLDTTLVPRMKPGEYAFAASGTSLQFDPSGGIWLATGGQVARIWYASSLKSKWTIWDTSVIQGEPATGLFSVAPRSSLRVVAVGGDYQNTDICGSNITVMKRIGDVKWLIPEGAVKVPFLECVRWMNASALVACGPPGVWFSPDRGLSWEEISTNGFHSMDLDVKARVAWLVGANGKVNKMLW